MPDTQQPPTSDNTASADRVAFGQRLSRSNTFLIRRLPSGELELWHRSSTREVIRTPIHQNDQGVYLDTDLWADFNRTLRYADLATLRRELSRVLQDTSHPSDLHPLATQASAALDAWERAAPPGERQDRRRAVSWIHASSSGSSVDLSSLDTLSSLPPLPASVRELKLGRGVRFHMANETHARVESVSSYPLLTRIALLPEGLHILELSGAAI